MKVDDAADLPGVGMAVGKAIIGAVGIVKKRRARSHVVNLNVLIKIIVHSRSGVWRVEHDLIDHQRPSSWRSIGSARPGAKLLDRGRIIHPKSVADGGSEILIPRTCNISAKADTFFPWAEAVMSFITREVSEGVSGEDMDRIAARRTQGEIGVIAKPGGIEPDAGNIGGPSLLVKDLVAKAFNE